MDDKIMEARRAKFEDSIKLDWGDHLAVFDLNDDGEYVFSDIRAAWYGYNAALDSVCVELPAEQTIDAGWDVNGHSAWDDVMLSTEVIQAIHAAGVRTK